MWWDLTNQRNILNVEKTAQLVSTENVRPPPPINYGSHFLVTRQTPTLSTLWMIGTNLHGIFALDVVKIGCWTIVTWARSISAEAHLMTQKCTTWFLMLQRGYRLANDCVANIRLAASIYLVIMLLPIQNWIFYQYWDSMIYSNAGDPMWRDPVHCRALLLTTCVGN